MTPPPRLLLRETFASALVNGVLSAMFVLLMFGYARPAPIARLGPDGLFQTGAVAFMGTLVPGLIANARFGGRSRHTVARAVAALLLAECVFGLPMLLLFDGQFGAVRTVDLFVLKTLFGAALGAVVTSISLSLLFRSLGRTDNERVGTLNRGE